MDERRSTYRDGRGRRRSAVNNARRHRDAVERHELSRGSIVYI